MIADAEARIYFEAGLKAGPKKAHFQSTLELDQILGCTPDPVRTLLPYVTIHSGRSGIDPLTAPLPLLAALSGKSPDEVKLLEDPEGLEHIQRSQFRLPQELSIASRGRSFLLRAEVHNAEPHHLCAGDDRRISG